MSTRRRTVSKTVCVVILSAFLFSCARAPLQSSAGAVRLVSAPTALVDDLPLEPMLSAIEMQVEFLERNSVSREFRFGDRVVAKADYLAGLRRFVELGRSERQQERFLAKVREEFDFFEVYGDRSWGDVFMTSYYEPVIPGSRQATDRFTQPIYAKPSDLVALDLARFDSKFGDERKLRGRIDGGALAPYYSREEIDSRGALRGRGLELCWLDPIDAFFLHVQGSGTVVLDDSSRIRLVYAEKNGHRYESVGKFLKDAIAPLDVNLHTIESYLRTLSAERVQEIFNLNPSYVFFAVSAEGAITHLGLSATDGRTIATDDRFFPKGALAFLSGVRPEPGPDGALEAAGEQPFARFVLDQDVGGAIKGGGRVDLFWGRGDEAKRYAGLMKHRGRLYYLLWKGLLPSGN